MEKNHLLTLRNDKTFPENFVVAVTIVPNRLELSSSSWEDHHESMIKVQKMNFLWKLKPVRQRFGWRSHIMFDI
jgi:hypothetical protein